MLSWLPTFFSDNFPQAQSWIFNVVPWLLMIPGIVIAGWVSNRLIIKGFNVGQTRKICEGLCGFTEACCLISIGKFLSPPKNMYVHTIFYCRNPVLKMQSVNKLNFRIVWKFIFHLGFNVDDTLFILCGFP